MVKILSMSGWTQPHDALREIVPNAEHVDYSAHHTSEQLFAHLQGEPYSGVVAWSLGAQLAVRAVQAGVLAPQWMVLLAPPMQFVNDAGFDGGMDPHTYSLFREGYAQAPKRTAARFHGLLAKGDRHMRRIIPQLGHHPQVLEATHWLPWLDELAAQTYQSLQNVVLPPTLIVQGAEDAIVPCTQAYAWKSHYPDIELHLVEGMGHTPHHHDGEMVKTLIAEHKAKHAL